MDLTQNIEAKKDPENNLMSWAILIAAVLIIFNQILIFQINSSVGPSTSMFAGSTSNILKSDIDFSKVDLSQIKNTAQSVAALFPLKNIKSADDAIKTLVPKGIPEYGQAMGVSSDDPIKSLDLMAKSYPALKEQIKKNPELWQRYINLATKPVGISCEYCCGVGPIGITTKGEITCGCQHAPALQTVTIWLMMNTKMNDAEILQEVLRWKTLFFPQQMVGMALQLAGGDSSSLQNVPGMVGGC